MVFITCFTIWKIQSRTTDTSQRTDDLKNVKYIVYDYSLNSGKLVKNRNQLVQYYSMEQATEKDIECIWLETSPRAPLCLHNNGHISNSILKEGMWQEEMVRLFQEILREDSELGVLDMGANVGVYSLVAAAMGRTVVALEPVIENLQRLHKAVKLGNYEQHVTLVTNFVSDTRDTKTLRINHENKDFSILKIKSEEQFCGRYFSCQKARSIFIDDLVGHLPFTKAILKLDLGKQLHRAFTYAWKLLGSVEFPYIFMEWLPLIQFYQSAHSSIQDKLLVEEMIIGLTDMGYIPYPTHQYADQAPLVLISWHTWPSSIVWVKGSVSDYEVY